MMGYAHNNTIVKVEKEPVEVEKFVEDSSELKKSNDPLDQSYIELEDFPDSFFDSLLNFDGWVEDNPISAMADVMSSEEKPNLGILEKSLEIKKEKEEEACESGKLAELGSLIEEGMGRVRLTSGAGVIDGVGSGDEDGMRNDVKQGGENVEVVCDGFKSGEVKGVNENEVMNDTEKGGDNGDVMGGGDSEESEDSEEKSSSSSSSSSSYEEEDDDDDDEDDEEDSDEEEEDGKGKKKVKGEVEMEEGEIRDFEVEEVGWSDDEDGNFVKGPVRSKNEVQDLPPVPPVNVTIEPHHQTLPVGVVLSIIGAQVIVEGVEKHNPLSEGSILWITESRSPLGVVDEIFGPVKNPYYMVRYNSESEVPTGIQQGSLISFVPEFADYVLNNNNLYKKGYDASGENDEELSEEVEFSDDEKEAEYKKMLKMSKRGSNEQKNGHMKKDKKSKSRAGNWKNDHRPSPTSQVQSFSGGPTSGPGMRPAFSPGPQAPNFPGHSSGVWPNGVPSIQPQNMGFPPNGFPTVPFIQQNFTQQPFQNLALPNLAPFHPQFNTTGQMFPSNFVQGVPPNFGANPAFASWPAGMPQNGFSQSHVGSPLAFQGLLSTPSMNVLPQGVVTPNELQMGNNGGMRPPMTNVFQVGNNNSTRPTSNGLQMENNCGMMPPMSENNSGMRPPFVAGNGETSQNPNRGNRFPNRGGRKPFQRGGGRFRGGRGGQGGRGEQQSR